MKPKYCITPIALLLAAAPVTASELQLAKGWRLPSKAEEIGDWASASQKASPAYRTRADFNGDGVVDDAYIALASKAKKWALFVNLNSVKGAPRIIKLDESRKNDPPQSMGVLLAEPGKHQTACGKGYWKGKKGEPAVLELKLPGIDLYQFEGANSFFWWNANAGGFTRTWMSD